VGGHPPHPPELKMEAEWGDTPLAPRQGSAPAPPEDEGGRWGMPPRGERPCTPGEDAGSTPVGCGAEHCKRHCSCTAGEDEGDTSAGAPLDFRG
jgi:hypothetical protein